MSVPTAGGLLADVAAFVAATAEPSSADRPVRLATVDPAYASGWPKVKFDGEATLSGKTYPHVDSYAPAKNDRVVLVPVGTTYLIIGAVSSSSAGGSAGLPAGSIVEFGGTTAPAGFRLCDGAALSRTGVTARLFVAIGTTWGAGDGTTTFNVPDFRGRTPIGAGTGSGLTARTVAASGGAETVQLTTTTMPSHGHTFTGSTSGSGGNHSHSLSGSVGSVGDHSHSYQSAASGPVGVVANGATSYAQVGSASTGGAGGHSHSMSGTADNAGDHTHSTSGSNSSTGGDGAHENMQPWRAVHYIIKI